MGVEDFASWQSRQQEQRRAGQEPPKAAAPIPTKGGKIEVQEHAAPGTTLVQQIRGALARRFRDEV
jgi:hypothetical protein